MKILHLQTLRGPNLWSLHTSIQAVVSCSEKANHLDGLPGFEVRLRERFPNIAPLPPGSSMATALEMAALGLQAHAGCPVAFSRSVATLEPGVYQVVVEYSEEAVGRLAFEVAVVLCNAALEDQPFDLTATLDRLRELDEDVRPGPSTGSIINAALARGIPCRRLTQGSLVQFGWGSKQRRIQAAEMDSTSAIGESIAQDKELTKRLLEIAGVPVPRGRPVADAEDAWVAALEIGGPVVVKPRDGNQGKGVAANIESRERILAAYASAREISSGVLVEQYLPGHDFRLLVIGNRLVAAARRDPPFVIGDGRHNIRELVEMINSDPLRSSGHATSLTRIPLDDIAIATLTKQGFDLDAVPRAGARVLLRNNANLSTGGTATDVTDDVHQDLADRAIAAANMIGLDLCGVDMVCESVMKSLENQSGGVIEINAAPGLRMHLQPSFGKGRPVGESIIDTMFARHEDGRIPVVAVAGTNGKTTTVRLIAHLIGHTGKRVGMTNSDGVYIGGQRIDTGDCSGPRSARNVLLHPDVDAAVMETARGGILREGLGFDRCNVAVVTNIGMGDHLGLNYIGTVEDLAVVKRVIVHSVTRSGVAVLNAADPMVADMANACPGSVTFIAPNRNERVLANHLAQGKRGVFVEDGHIVAAKGKLRYRIPLNAIPITHNGTIGFQIENAMAATAAAWGLGIPWSTIRNGLASFANTAQSVPGRFNFFNYHGATVIADYGHNPDAIRALVQAVTSMPAKRRMVVISGAGDRRDADLRLQTEILGDVFDDVILYQDDCQRGRAEGEVLAILRDGLTHSVRATHIEEIRGEFLAIDTALSRLESGDLCLILIDQIDQSLAHIAMRTAEGKKTIAGQDP
jgi:cyanophycin synthetase